MAMGRFNHDTAKQYLHEDMHDFIPADSDYFYREHYKDSPEAIDSIRLLDIRSFMGELVLTKIDRASMAHSLEVRVPFLDNRLVEYLLHLKSKVYFGKHQPKKRLSALLLKWLPLEFITRKKQGFVGPDQYYMNIDWYAKQLQNGNLVHQKILSQQGLDRLIAAKDHWRLMK
jgi:asparagine synthase (glutamine-hydrolysing)